MLTAKGVTHVIMVYVGGHGASENEQLVYLLNSEKPEEAMFPLEQKLRKLVNEEDSLCKVFAVYDCCRVKLEGIRGL